MRVLHQNALQVLAGWAAPDDDQERLRTAYVEHLRTHDDALSRTGVPAHLTASVLVLDPSAERVLLTLHRTGGFWAQMGGHCEPSDATLAGAAVREGVEESGIAALRIVGAGPVDLDRHELAAVFGTCRAHLDVRYAAVAPVGAEPVVSEESTDVAWFPVDALPAGVAGDIGRLVTRARAALAASGQLTSPGSSSRSSSSDRPSPAVADTPSR